MRANGKIAGVVYRRHFDDARNQYYMDCVHQGQYISTKKKDEEENKNEEEKKDGGEKKEEDKLKKTIRRGCEAQIYAKMESDSYGNKYCVIKRIRNKHNHEPLTEEEYKTAPQSNKLTPNSKSEALKLYQEGEKISFIIQHILNTCYKDVKDQIQLTALKNKLQNYLNNRYQHVYLTS